jgi:hypothetical protein
MPDVCKSPAHLFNKAESFIHLPSFKLAIETRLTIDPSSYYWSLILLLIVHLLIAHLPIDLF